MITKVQRSLLIIFLILTVINLAGHIMMPTPCCTVQENPGSASDADCMVCTLQVGVWLPQQIIAYSLTYISNVIIDNPVIALGHSFTFYHPPIA